MRDPETDLRRHIAGGRKKHRNLGFGPEFESAQLLAEDVQRELLEWRTPRSACPANPRQSAMLDSGASDHMIGRSLLTPAEQATIYKVPPKTYALAEGHYTLDEAVKLWIPFVGEIMEFRVSDSMNSPMIAEGKLCRDHGC